MKSRLIRIIGVAATVAIVASSLVAPAAAVTTPSLVVGSTTISAATTYTVTFNLAQTQPASATGIVVTADTGINVAGATATITTSGGLGTAPITTTAITVTAAAQVLTFDTTSAGVGAIGAGAVVQLVISGVINPAAVGDYGVTVKTAVETTAVASNKFTATVPGPVALPGVATLLNSAGITMTQSNSIATVIAGMGANTGWTITLTAGTYNETFALVNASTTIKAADGVAASTIILKPSAAIAIAADKVTIQGITIDESTAALSVGAAGTNFTIKDCVFKTGTGGAANLLVVGAAGGTVDGSTFTVTGSVAVQGIQANANMTVKNSTFAVDTGATAIVANANVTIDKITVTGGSGTALSVTAGSSSLTGSTLTTLSPAISVSGGSLSVSGNTIDASGTATTGPATIAVTGTTGLAVFSNKITNSKYYVATVAANSLNTTFQFNDFSGSAKGFSNTDPAVPPPTPATLVSASNNWWGAGVDPTATGFNTANVDVSNKLGAAPGTGTVAVAPATAAVSNSTLGVTVTVRTAGGVLSIPGIVGVASYAANPTGVNTPSTVTAKSYYDVLVKIPAVATDVATVRINGTTAAPITSSSVVLIYNSLFGRWDPATISALNTFANYIEASIPVSMLAGTPIVLATTNPTLPAPGGVGVALAFPALGGTNVAIDTTFTWPAVAGATGYEFVIAEDLGETDKFAIIDYSATTQTNAHKLRENLKYDTTYYWRVRATTATLKSDWTVLFFTTAKEPAAPPPPEPTPTFTVTQTITPPPEITLEIPPAPVPVNVIPEYLLWAVIAIGAVLIIVVVVLVVRTRRIG